MKWKQRLVIGIAFSSGLLFLVCFHGQQLHALNPWPYWSNETAASDDGEAVLVVEKRATRPSHTSIGALVREKDGSRMPASSPAWLRWQMQITDAELYGADDALTRELLRDMAEETIVAVEEKTGGTQVKLVVRLANDMRALFKPMRLSREYETPADHFYFVDFERHNAEIAAFHLDRLLGFRRVPPTVGRVVNMSADLRFNAEDSLASTFFTSPAGNLCFTGHCSYYCDTSHAICGRPRDRLEGSLQMLLPNKGVVGWSVHEHPFRRSYNKKKLARWEKDPAYCDKVVRNKTEFQRGRRLLDVVDMSVLDFLTGNMDRHHYELFRLWANSTFSFHLDNGRSFGKTKHDELSCLTSLSQCCVMRNSTFALLAEFEQGPLTLGTALKRSLKTDPLNPVLVDGHFSAIDRRVKIILSKARNCIQEKGDAALVLLEDGF